MLEFRPNCCSDHEPASLLPLTDTDTPSAPTPDSQRYSAVRHVNLSPTDFSLPGFSQRDKSLEAWTHQQAISGYQ